MRTRWPSTEFTSSAATNSVVVHLSLWHNSRRAGIFCSDANLPHFIAHPSASFAEPETPALRTILRCVQCECVSVLCLTDDKPVGRFPARGAFVSRSHIGAHSDTLSNIGPQAIVAGVSLGAKRVFVVQETLPWGTKPPPAGDGPGKKVIELWSAWSLDA